MRTNRAAIIKAFLLISYLFFVGIVAHATIHDGKIFCSELLEHQKWPETHLQSTKLKDNSFVEFNTSGLGHDSGLLLQLQAGFRPLFLDPRYLDLYDVRNGGFPFRRRAMSKLVLDKYGTSWNIVHQEVRGFSQKSSDSYLNNTVRHFEPIPDNFLLDESFAKLIRSIAREIDILESGKVISLEIVVHMMIVMARIDGQTSNSPEGIHQDGFDYLVPALVIQRKNIVGGKTSFYDADKKTILASRELQEGEGQIFAEGGSDIWHEASPIRLIDPKEFGYRASIGFDITVLNRAR